MVSLWLHSEQYGDLDYRYCYPRDWKCHCKEVLGIASAFFETTFSQKIGAAAAQMPPCTTLLIVN